MSISFAFAEQMPDGYYDAANGTKDAELKGTLKEIIRDHTVMSYGSGANSSWYVFYYSDQDENGYCMDMYCDDWKKFTTPGEVVSGCNVEHSFAKSWWGGAKNDAYKDCYHLNPSNSTANSARSNYPLGVPQTDIKTSGSLRIGKRHHEELNTDHYVFEPKDEYKGDFARAYFYMVTCYGKDKNGNYDPTICSQYQGWRLDNKDVGSKFAMQNDNYLEFQPWEQEVLITWHRQDPVSEKEIKRADAVSNFQHNRNPFIDYPFLAEYIWGDYAGQELNLSQLIASFEDGFVPGVSNGWREGSVTPTPKKKYGVTWSVCGEELRVDSVVENKKVTALPDEPESCSAESNVFMGWTTTPIQGISASAPETLYTAANDIPAITADITLHAVFARKTTSGSSEPKTYVFDADHQDGWTNTATNKGSYWLLETGKTIVSPEIDLMGLSKITVNMRTYGGTSNNQLDIYEADGKLTSIIATNGKNLTDYEWMNNLYIAGTSVLTFSSSYGADKGIGIASIIIDATGSSTSYDKYLTHRDDTTIEVSNQQPAISARKVLRNGQIYIRVDDATYTIMGQRIE